MRCFSRLGAAAVIFLLSVSCTSTTEVTLPTIDATEAMQAEALVVLSDYSRGFDAPTGVVRGAGEGASRAMGGYLGGAATGGGEAFLLGLILAPIGLPISAAVGAGLAHSEEEVDAAVSAFNKLGQDKELLISIGRRTIEILNKHAERKNWGCIEAASTRVPKLCHNHKPIAWLRLRPAFRLETIGGYDPDILFFGDVVALASVGHLEADDAVEAKWAYRDEFGKFFALAQDDAALLRGKIEDILDRFAKRIAEDLFLAPRSETIVRKKEFSGRSFTTIPQGVVVRVEQGTNLASLASHGMVRPQGHWFGEDCWIDTVDGMPTGQGETTAMLNREVTVKAGRARLVVFCVTRRGWATEVQEHHTIEVDVEPGVAYVTDGRTYERFQP